MEPLRLYHSRSSAFVMAGGGILLASLFVWAAVNDQLKSGWSAIAALIGAFGAIVGLRRLFATKPAIIVDDEGLLSASGAVSWASIRGVDTRYSGVPAKLFLCVVTDNGQTDYCLQDLSISQNRALQEIKSRFQQKRPDLMNLGGK